MAPSNPCFQPGWNDGPDKTGEASIGFMCELDGDHTGDHGWDIVWDDTPETTWPVTKEEVPNGDNS